MAAVGRRSVAATSRRASARLPSTSCNAQCCGGTAQHQALKSKVPGSSSSLCYRRRPRPRATGPSPRGLPPPAPVPLLTGAAPGRGRSGVRAPCRKTTCTSFSSRSRRPGAAAAARRRCAHRARPPRRPRRVPQPMAAAAAEGAGADGKRSPPAGSGERQGPGGGLQLPEGAAPDGGSRREQARGAGRGPGEGRGRGGAGRPGPAPPRRDRWVSPLPPPPLRQRGSPPRRGGQRCQPAGSPAAASLCLYSFFFP